MTKDNSYCDNFAWQWQTFRKTQIDRFSQTSESKQRFLAETGWTPEQLQHQLVLDAGCGSGRFSALVSDWGAKVVAIDLAFGAAQACAQNLRELGLPVQVVQASLYALPFRPGTFDRIFSLGVLQHTPDPRLAIQALPPLLKPNGQIALWIYEKRWTRYFMLRNYLRVLTRRLPLKIVWRFCWILVALFFPLTLVISRLPILHKLLPLAPIAARHYWGRLTVRQQWEWTLLDTIDSYSAVYENNQSEPEVIETLRACGLVQIRRNGARGMAIIGHRAR